ALIGVATFAGEGKKVVGELRGVTGRIGSMETRLQGLDSVLGLAQQVVTIESRLQAFDTKFDKQLVESGELKATIAALDKTIGSGFQDIKASMESLRDSFEKKLDSQEARFEKRLERLQ